MKLKHAWLFCMTALVFLFAVSCQSSPTSVSAPVSKSQKAVFISGGNGGGYTVFVPGDTPGQVVTLSDGKSPACADCKAAAMKYFETGVLEPKCPTCGATRSAFTLRDFGTNHN